MKVEKVAILIDGGFFVQRFKAINKTFPTKTDVENIISELISKIKLKSDEYSKDILFRTYYYDCLPYDQEIKTPSGKKIDYSKSKVFNYKTGFINDLRKMDQFALRLGELSFTGWKVVKDDLPPIPDFKQKGVDMKIGLDMAWMAGKRTVDKIILVAGDSDFISPMKLVRREGILVYVFPMGNPIKLGLREHSDFILS